MAICLGWKAHSEVASSASAGFWLPCSLPALRCAVSCSALLSVSAMDICLPPICSHNSLTMPLLNSALHVPCPATQPHFPVKDCCPPS